QEPWVLDLHDVLLSIDGNNEADRFERSFIAQYDATLVCSDEDAALVRHTDVTVVPNGARATPLAYVPSRGNKTILFAGPFRYAPNLHGVRQFLAHVYPKLRRRISDVELIILGGNGARQAAAADPAFSQPGVTVYDQVDDVYRYLRQCSLTINPLHGIRGSSIKLIESLAAGRACVSTTDGARGLLKCECSALITVNAVADFETPVAELMLNEEYRIELEKPSPAFLEAVSWRTAAKRLQDVYRKHMKPREQGAIV
ncbi:MAG: glycosyltransferase, partial [Acidobacteriaceae bacterium]|nr:glycosyltransferase [Acidobacteriaceae bacterium]